MMINIVLLLPTITTRRCPSLKRLMALLNTNPLFINLFAENSFVLYRLSLSIFLSVSFSTLDQFTFSR